MANQMCRHMAPCGVCEPVAGYSTTCHDITADFNVDFVLVRTYERALVHWFRRATRYMAKAVTFSTMSSK